MSVRARLLELLNRADELVKQQQNTTTVAELVSIYRETRDLQHQSGISPADWIVAEIKSIDDVLKSYRAALRRIARSFFAGSVSRSTFERAISDDIRVDAEDVFAEGLREGGGDPAEMTDQERSYLDDWIHNQVSFVSGLADAAEEARGDRKLRGAVMDRIDMWVDSMRTLGMTAKGFASANQMGQWKLGQTEKHCDTCSKLANDKPHRLSWFLSRGYIPRENGSSTLQCKGFKCDCGIFSVKTGERLM